MVCNNCGNINATYHKTTIRNGIKNEVHLCGLCAIKIGNGFEIKNSIFKSLNIGEFFGDFEPKIETKHVPLIKRCVTCGTKFSDFSKTGLLGCCDCYKTFSLELIPIIANSQGKNIKHLGKKGVR